MSALPRASICDVFAVVRIALPRTLRIKFVSEYAATPKRALTSYIVPASFVHLSGEQLEADDGVNDDDKEN